jgi:hypothetical protein
MKVIEDQNYRQAYPETYRWSGIDSITVCNLAYAISSHIEHDLRTSTRLFVPGLRKALNLIAETAEA